MQPSLRSSTPDATWHSRDWEAHMLAGLLRSSRIMVLYGEPGAGKTALLHDALLPLLRRRATDAPSPVPPAGSGVVIPFPDRRQRHRDVEVVVCFDQWEDTPLPALMSMLATTLGVAPPASDARLAEVLDAWHRQRGSRFLLPLDGFEACLAAQAQRPEAAEFIVQLTEVVNHPTLPASVLVSLRSDAEPGLDRLRHRIAGFDRHWLRLPHWRRGSAPSREPPHAPVAPEAPQTSSPSGHGFIRLDLTAEPEPLPPVPSASTAATATRPGFTFQWLGWMVAAASILLLAWSWFAPHPAAPVVATPVDASPPAPPPERIARDLAWLAPPPSATASSRPWPAGFIALSDQPPLALARHDALQAARGTPSGLQVVAPLYTEQIHVLVRADSPLRALHDLTGHRIAVDTRHDADALTLRNLYSSLAGRAPADDQLQRLEPEAALKALLDARSVDALAVVAPDPSDWLAALDARTRQSMRLLPFDARQAGSPRVTQRYLPMARAADAGPALSVMTFLVTRESPAAAGPLREVVQALCKRWPALLRDGHPAWRSVDPARQLPVGWPYAPAIRPEDWRACKP